MIVVSGSSGCSGVSPPTRVSVRLTGTRGFPFSETNVNVVSPLGSVTVTDGQLFRCLTGVPYYGLSLTRDGLHMHVGDDPADVLAANPTQTWSFYIECPVIRDHQSILDPNWRFTTAPAMRTIISCIDEHNFILLTVTRDGSSALTMRQCVDYLQSAFDPGKVGLT